MTDEIIGPLLLVAALVFGGINLLVYIGRIRQTRGIRRYISVLIWVSSAYTVVIYALSLAGSLPDGFSTLSMLLRPVLVGFLAFFAAYGILDRRSK